MKKLVITTARIFDDEQKKVFEEKIFKTFGQSVLEYHVDEALIGGVIIFDGSKVYDGSFKNKLQRISDLLKKD